MSDRAWPWLAGFLLLVPALLGLFLWRSQGARIWLADFVAACF